MTVALAHSETVPADFNSHAHVERDNRYRVTFPVSVNFNSHAHVERDPLTQWQTQTSEISTHTLTWSVTFCTNFCHDFVHFNSHAHVERDT